MVLKQCNSLCILCFKLASSSLTFELSSKKTRDWNVSTSEQFMLLLSRHLNLCSKETPSSHVKRELLFCEVCSKLAKSFLQLYFQLECIRLEVEWNVRKMYETMLCAGRVSSRFNAFKTQFEPTSKPSGDEEEDEETKRLQEVFTDLIKLRKNIIRKAKQQLKSSLPKVKLKRLSEPDKAIKTEAKSSPIKTHPLKKLELVTALLTSIVVVHLSLPQPLHPSNIPNSFQESSICVPPESDLLFMEEDLEEDAPSPTSAQYDEAPLSNHSCCDDDDDNQMSVAVEFLVKSNESYETNLETENAVQMELDESNFTTNVDVIDDRKDDKSETMTSLTISIQKDSMGGEELCNIVQKLDEPSRNNVIELGPENLVKMETDEASNKDNQDDYRNDTDLEQVSITSIEKEPEEDFQRKSLRTILKCSKCPNTFANQKSLNAHKRTHQEKVLLESESDSSSSNDEEMNVDSEDEDQDVSETHSDLEIEMNLSEKNEKLETELEAKQKITKITKNIISKTRTKVKESSTAKVKRIPTKIPPNECEICHETFSCEGAVEKHRVIHHKLKEYARCHPCGKLFGSHAYLQRHQIGSPCLGKGPQRDFPLQFPTFGGQREGNKFCPLEGCYEVFPFEEYVDIHVKAHGDFKCLQCPQEFTKAHEFAWHEVTHHNDKDKNRPVKFSYARKDPSTKLTFRCSRCNYGFDRRTSLLTHFTYKHLGIPNVRTSGKVKNQCKICKHIFAPYACKKTINQHKKLHNVEGLDPSAVATCGICKAPFINLGLLTQHLRSTHNKVKFDCPHCDKKHLNSKQLLKNHIKSKHPGKTTGAPGEFECKICKERFDNKYNFGAHMKAHEVNDKHEFKCEKCSAVFRKNISLKKHYNNIHKAPKEILPCETCGKVFKNAVKLKQHKSYTHTDPSEWKFLCEEEGCGKRCWSRQKLREHMRTHTKERPFVCDFCGETYRYRQYLRTHLAKVHGESAANTLPTQLYTKPFDEVMRKQHETIEKEGSSDSSDSTT
ncbi:unnamed protein product [Orchesella dallaii]|uniref:C2H2-type domain-containing protein n=1 Tax=Orchesella dallaii TaxID=48710 RepID=A0ABP1QZG2_9HEXA